MVYVSKARKGRMRAHERLHLHPGPYEYLLKVVMEKLGNPPALTFFRLGQLDGQRLHQV